VTWVTPGKLLLRYAYDEMTPNQTIKNRCARLVSGGTVAPPGQAVSPSTNAREICRSQTGRRQISPTD
jgi:hypothetical protein